MCGICGATQDHDGSRAAAMNAAMVHRGPDDDGVHVDAPTGASLGARRLSIIDVGGGHQPLANEDETVWAVLNGEVYNYRALRPQLEARGHVFRTNCDTEVLVHLYEEHGEAMVHALEGMYAFAVWDARSRVLVLGRDRFGEKPLFYSERDGHLTFASELTALEAGIGALEVDPAAIDAYFVLGYVPGSRSFAHGVRQLSPAHLLRWTPDGGAEVRRYWQMPERATADARNPREIEGEALSLMRAGVASRLVADVPVGVFLSGGIDSTLVTALAAQEIGDQVRTFTVGYDVGTVNESTPAAETARALDTEHRHLTLTSAMVGAQTPALLQRLDQPNADPALMALHAVSAMAREHVTVAVGGEGADELFGGYPRYRWLSRASRIERRVPRVVAGGAAGVLRRAGGTSRSRRLVDVLAPAGQVERHIDWVTERRRHERPGLYGPRMAQWREDDQVVADASPIFGSPGREGVPAALMALDQQRYLPDDVLAKADRASMLSSLEMRTPFLSRDLAEFSATLRTADLLAGGGKPLLRGMLAAVAPQVAGSRPKTAFRVPAAEWLRGPLAQSLSDQADAGRIVTDEWLDRPAYASLVRRHISGETDASAILWPTYVLGQWLDRSPG